MSLKEHFDKHPEAGHRADDPDHIKIGRAAVDGWMAMPEQVREQLSRGEF